MAEDDPDQAILIIDDDPSCLDVSSALLRRGGYDVYTASEWTEVTEVVFKGQQKIDLVLLDVTMPAVRGDRLVPILERYAGSGTPIVLYSGLPKERLEELARDSGAAGFLQKGWVAGLELVEAVRELLATQRAS
jgi:CheY-like chemotaxis protein